MYELCDDIPYASVGNSLVYAMVCTCPSQVMGNFCCCNIILPLLTKWMPTP